MGLKDHEININLTIDRTFKTRLENQYKKMPYAFKDVYELFVDIIGILPNEQRKLMLQKRPMAVELINAMERKEQCR